MAELPHPWGMYARLQNNLRRNHQVSDRSWGTEAGMDYILQVAAATPPAEDKVNQVIATSRRRERSRGSRRAPLLEDIATPDPHGALTARRELEAIYRKVGNDNWKLLTAVATGLSYSEISDATSITPGALRVQVMRLRESIAIAA